jgi:hypothetical protein
MGVQLFLNQLWSVVISKEYLQKVIKDIVPVSKWRKVFLVNDEERKDRRAYFLGLKALAEADGKCEIRRNKEG